MQQTEEVIRVALCIVRSKNRHLILILRRSAANASGVGQWECPGGKCKDGQSMRKSLDEEILEETGLDIIIRKEEEFLKVDRSVVAKGPHAGKTFVTEFIIGLDERRGAGDVKLDPDHDACAWVTPHEALDHDLTRETRLGLIALLDRLKVPA